jgi:hypothetical protein
MKKLRVILYSKEKETGGKPLEEWPIELNGYVYQNLYSYFILYIHNYRKYLIGRNPEKTNITISDGTISRIHAELLYTSEGKIVIKDLGSGMIIY